MCMLTFFFPFRDDSFNIDHETVIIQFVIKTLINKLIFGEKYL